MDLDGENHFTLKYIRVSYNFNKAWFAKILLHILEFIYYLSLNKVRNYKSEYIINIFYLIFNVSFSNFVSAKLKDEFTSSNTSNFIFFSEFNLLRGCWHANNDGSLHCVGYLFMGVIFYVLLIYRKGVFNYYLAFIF